VVVCIALDDDFCVLVWRGFYLPLYSLGEQDYMEILAGF
jgi:hypothetical protein